VAVIGVTLRTVLQEWRAQVIKESAVNAIMLVALLVLATLYDWRAESSRQLLVELARSHQDLERQVEERTAHLAASNAELAQFTFIASHDLQEPLRSVSSFLQLLQRRYGGRLGADADEYIGFAVDGAKRMSTLLNDVLAYAQIGRPGLLPVRCDTAALVRDALESLGGAGDSEIRLGDLPAVMGIPSQIHCLFQNLLGNALKYRAPGRHPVVAVSASLEDGGWARFTVQDNGIGIDPSYHDRIFKIFQRLHRREEFEGTGIGLALCKKIVESEGGRLWVDSSPGQGSAFCFTLPLAD
jgi:light-regulated signal transduction histidine kinase (bacteriophytochrome)